MSVYINNDDQGFYYFLGCSDIFSIRQVQCIVASEVGLLFVYKWKL